MICPLNPQSHSSVSCDRPCDLPGLVHDTPLSLPLMRTQKPRNVPAAACSPPCLGKRVWTPHVSYAPCWCTTGKRAARQADAPLHGGGAASKGWSALAGARIAAGAFLCLYAGELLSSAEAAARLAAYDRAAAERPGDPGHALLVRGWCRVYGLSRVLSRPALLCAE